MIIVWPLTLDRTQEADLKDDPSPESRTFVIFFPEKTEAQNLKIQKKGILNHPENCNFFNEYLKSPLRYTFWQIFRMWFLDEIVLDLFSGSHTGERKNLEITTYQNMYLTGDFRYNLTPLKIQKLDYNLFL